MIKTVQEEEPEILGIIEKEYGFVSFRGEWDLNIIGLRRIGGREDNQFDDKLLVIYMENGKWVTEEAVITTDPGRYWLTKADYKPCAIYHHPQQARGAYTIGKHRGSYSALVQRKPVRFWRDGDKDEHANYRGIIFSDIIGLNIHRSSTREGGSEFVNRWSAGCQVFQNSKSFKRFMFLCYKQVEERGFKNFTYTLIPME